MTVHSSNFDFAMGLEFLVPLNFFFLDFLKIILMGRMTGFKGAVEEANSL